MWTLLLVETAAETPRPSEVERKLPQAESWTSGAAEATAASAAMRSAAVLDCIADEL